MKFHVLTLFPEMIMNGLNTSILGKAAEKGLISFNVINFRDYTEDKHGKVDDYPYGGGAGMLIQAQPVFSAYQSILSHTKKKPRTVYLTPQGKRFDQNMAREFAKEEEVIFLCGHYEGVDERVLEEIVTDNVSIGDYVLTGGELPVMVMIDAISRMVPGVLNNQVSGETESFHNDLLEYPQYTRPEVWHEKKVPEVLLSGNHKKIMEWRLEQSINRTKQNRPDLYAKYREKQEVIKRLLKKKRTFVHMIEFLDRGLGELYYAKELNVCVGNANITLVCAQSTAEAEKLYKEQKHHFSQTVITPQAFFKDFLIEQCETWTAVPYMQACYTNKVPLHVSYKDIRTEENGSFIALHGDDVIGRLVIGADGGLVCAWIDNEYVEKDIMQSLLACAINRQIFDMQIPFIQVEQNNRYLLKMLDDMGLYFADEPIWKLTNQ